MHLCKAFTCNAVHEVALATILPNELHITVPRFWLSNEYVDIKYRCFHSFIQYNLDNGS